MMRRPGSVEAMAEIEVQRASDRSAVARRLLRELYPYRATLLAAFGFIVIGGLAQGTAPYLVGRAIDRDVQGHDGLGLLRTLAELFCVYGAGALAQRAQTVRVGGAGQHVLAELRARLFEQLQIGRAHV